MQGSRRQDRFTHDEKALRCTSKEVVGMEIENLLLDNSGMQSV